MEKSYNKVITISFVIGALLAAYVTKTIIGVLSNTWGTFARISNETWVQHGLPIGVGAIFFFVMVLNPKIRAWATDVTLEISKIVWPSIKDTRSLTIVVCIIIFVAALILSIFDVVSGNVIDFILDL